MNRDDLKDYKYNQDWIKDRLEYIKGYKESILSITTILSDMPRGSNKVQDSIAEKIAELLDTVNDLMKKTTEESRKQKEIVDQLDLVEQPYRIILDKVYIQGKSLVTTASEMNYDYKYICKQHGIALEKFENTTKKVESD